MREWFENKIQILSTPTGAGIGIACFLVGIMIGKMILMFASSINNM